MSKVWALFVCLQKGYRNSVLGTNASRVVKLLEDVLAGYINGKQLHEEHKRKLYEESEARK